MKNHSTNRVRGRQTAWWALGASLLLCAGLQADPPSYYFAHLSGKGEVPQAATRAQGQALFWLSDDGTQLHYMLIVANIHDVLQSHIHLGPADANGPIVAFLYPPGPPAVLIPGRSQGVLAEGTLTDASLIGPLTGMTLSDLVDEIEAGNAYVNVHTLTNPRGEIRGQIKKPSD